MHIINRCICSEVYPKVLERADIVPIPRCNSSTFHKQCRPIALTTNLAKVFEKGLKSQLQLHLDKFQLLSSRQSGFRSGQSCKTLLLKVTESWRKSLDAELVAMAAFLDLGKAFPSVAHQKLRQKLSDTGVTETALRTLQRSRRIPNETNRIRSPRNICSPNTKNCICI